MKTQLATSEIIKHYNYVSVFIPKGANSENIKIYYSYIVISLNINIFSFVLLKKGRF